MTIRWFEALGEAQEAAARDNRVLLTYIWAPG